MFKQLRIQRSSTKREFSRQCFSESPMSGEYFGRLIANGAWAFVCYLAVKYVTVQEIG